MTADSWRTAHLNAYARHRQAEDDLRQLRVLSRILCGKHYQVHMHRRYDSEYVVRCASLADAQTDPAEIADDYERRCVMTAVGIIREWWEGKRDDVPTEVK